MRMLICPDKFAGTLSAAAAAEAVAEGWRERAPGDDLTLRPLSDGGPGFVEVLAAAGRRSAACPVRTTDPLGRPVDAEVLLVADGATAYVESAQACGLHLLAPDERDPKRDHLVRPGRAGRAPRSRPAPATVVIGLGGSATNDGGAGMLAALGAAPLDEAGAALPYGGAALAHAAGLGGIADAAGRDPGRRHRRRQPADRAARRVAACSARRRAPTAPTCCCSTPRWSGSPACSEQDLPGCPAGLAALPGAGAAGGLGAAILALGGRCESGIGLVTGMTGLDGALDAADLVITGEGSFDHQSLRGKVVAGVAGGGPRPGRALRGAGRPGQRRPAGGRRGRDHRDVQPGRPLRQRSRRRWPARPRACAELGARLARAVVSLSFLTGQRGRRR